MQMNKKVLGLVGFLLFLFGTSISLTNAFLSKPVNELNNVITPGAVKIQLQEPEWKPENGKNLVPGKTTAKDPQITNTGENAAWIFLRLDVPVRNISVVDGVTKRKKPAENTELFVWQPSEHWTMIEHTVDEQTARYVFGYQKILEPGQKTSPLFQEVSLVNVLEGELDETETFVMPIEAVAIQNHTDSEGDGLKKIYAEFLKQEEADGREDHK